VIASARECLTPMFDAPHPGCEIMPVFSSGQSVIQAAATYQALGTVDLMFAAGGGIMAHPGGPAAGVRALLLAWQAAVEGVPLADAAKDAPELRAAMGAFGG
jgi:ribulose-bisphosphate carboxylase large chain